MTCPPPPKPEGPFGTEQVAFLCRSPKTPPNPDRSSVPRRSPKTPAGNVLQLHSRQYPRAPYWSLPTPEGFARDPPKSEDLVGCRRLSKSVSSSATSPEGSVLVPAGALSPVGIEAGTLPVLDRSPCPSRAPPLGVPQKPKPRFYRTSGRDGPRASSPSGV